MRDPKKISSRKISELPADKKLLGDNNWDTELMSPPSSLGSVEAGRPPRNASITAGTPNLVQNEISHSFSHILHRSASYKRKLLDWTWSLWERTADGDRITTYIQDVLLILNIRPKQITVLKQKLFDLYPNKPKV